MSERLNQLLNDDGDTKTIISYTKNRSRSPTEINMPPSLKELREKGNIVINSELRNVSQVAPDDDDAKRELMFKIELLKKSYPGAYIPEFNIYSDYASMKKTYESTLRRLSLDSSVENYKTYLIGGFMLCEYVFGNFLKLDMEGFTQQQIISMSSYDKLLIELGEKSYMPDGSNWPVEVRLIGLIIINAAFFVISKLIMNQTGTNLMGMINSMNQPIQNVTRKKKMSGPTINLDELPVA